jgi:hypothetical protein
MVELTKATRGRADLIGTLFVTGLAVAVLAAAGPSAAAATSTASCPVGTETTTYSPGVTNESRLITRRTTDAYGPCISSEPNIESATASDEGSVVRSCTTLLAGATFDKTIKWNTGQTSTIQLDVTVNYVAGSIVAAGHGVVVDGLFSGATAATTSVLPANLLLCDTPTGITSLFGVDTLTIG